MRLAEPTSARRPSTMRSLAWSTAPGVRCAAGQRQRRAPVIVPKRLALRSGVAARAVLLGLEHDIDLAPALDGVFEVRCELGEGVGREADKEDERTAAKQAVRASHRPLRDENQGDYTREEVLVPSVARLTWSDGRRRSASTWRSGVFCATTRDEPAANCRGCPCAHHRARVRLLRGRSTTRTTQPGKIEAARSVEGQRC